MTSYETLMGLVTLVGMVTVVLGGITVLVELCRNYPDRNRRDY